MNVSILGAPSITPFQAEEWARYRSGTNLFVALADVYWTHATQRGGVRPEVAYAQAAKEMAFGRFGGTDAVFSANPTFCNPCGLKTRNGKATKRFFDWHIGVIAHLDHLALYAGASGYPRLDTPDPRHFPYLHGDAPTVHDLSNHWSGEGYGESLDEKFLTTLITYKAA